MDWQSAPGWSVFTLGAGAIISAMLGDGQPWREPVFALGCALIIVSVVLFAWPTIKRLRARVNVAAAPRMEPPAIMVPDIDIFIPLAEASRRLYEATITTLSEEAARNNDGGIISWYAELARGRGVAIYGKRPPSSVRELVPSTSANSLNFDDGASSLFEFAQNSPSYVDLEVKKSDFDRLLSGLTDNQS